MSKKIEVEIVGVAGDETLYIQFFKDGTPIPSELYRLQYPGNSYVEKMSERMIEQKGDETKIKLSLRTREFFSKCAFPLSEGNTELERDLIEQFGANTRKKIDVDKIHPALFPIWQRVIARFLDGDLFADVFELTTRSDAGGASGGGEPQG
ncbi:hypothetical protein [Leptospira interrogans]|uniref:Uncharacterized protein n=1 Tax=Leptospira interrogans str. UI 12758 TaxID=1049938 RepID=A0A0E2D2V2_LEPIR|nr:hypothetical protein [Leptospira interrogans]EKR54316.1 hypothetical protein LEP1GSC105_2931 [Leptospira interrogans str. UI 12758]